MVVLLKNILLYVIGLLNNSIGTINAPIARKPNSIIERCVDSLGNVSITHYEVLDTNALIGLSLLKLKIETR